MTIGARVFFVSESLKTVKAILTIVNVKTTLSFCDLYVERGDHIFSGILPLVVTSVERDQFRPKHQEMPTV